VLRGGALTRYRRGRMAEEPVARERLRDVIRDEFAIDVPDVPFVFERPR
jgi:hypothetical protein